MKKQITSKFNYIKSILAIAICCTASLPAFSSDAARATKWDMSSSFYSEFYEENRKFVPNSQHTPQEVLILGRPGAENESIYEPQVTTGNRGRTGAEGDEALSFDGANNVAHTFPDHTVWDDNWADFIVEFYFKPKDIGSAQDMVSAPGAWAIQLVNLAGGMAEVRFSANGGQYIARTEPFDDSALNQWHHIKASAIHNELSIALNEVEGQKVEYENMNQSNWNNIFLGSSPWNTRNYNGLLDDLQISGRYGWSSLDRDNLTWNPEVNLWKSHFPGNSPDTKDLDASHISRYAAGNLLLAGVYNILSHPNTEKVLQVFIDMQNEQTGNIKWHYEDQQIYDSNAGFFVCKKLLLLNSNYRNQLTQNAKNLIDHLFEGFYNWHYEETLDGAMRYPNKYLGDLICTKLLQELMDPPAEHISNLRDKMLESADYWLNQNWGWGEHMSNIYAKVCLDLLSQYILFSEDKDSEVFALYKELFDDLMCLEDKFEGGPRVPAIRNNNYSSAPPQWHYAHYKKEILDPRRELAKQPSDGSIHVKFTTVIRGVYFDNGWHEILMPHCNLSEVVHVPCFDDSAAKAFIKDDFRIGAMSNYPIMANTEYLSWGLSYQSFPVLMWRPEGDWGFLQWQTLEDGGIRAHPREVASGPVALTSKVNPPPVGETYSLKQGGDFLILRRMPTILNSWDKVSDFFKIIDQSTEFTQKEPIDSWHQILLEYPQRTVSVNFIPLSHDINASLNQQGHNSYWGGEYPKNVLSGQRIFNLWAISSDTEITSAPVIEDIEGTNKKTLSWDWDNGTNWNVIIDTAAEEPIYFIEQ